MKGRTGGDRGESYLTGEGVKRNIFCFLRMSQLRSVQSKR